MLFFLGLIWAVMAPLLMGGAIVLIAIAMRRIRPATSLALSRVVAAVAVFGTVLAFWTADSMEFSGVCDTSAAAAVYRKESAPGMLLSSQTANSFGTRYLYDEGFEWIEAKDYAKPNAWVRYVRDKDGVVSSVSIAAPGALHEVVETHSRPFSHTGLSLVEVKRRDTGEVLSKAGGARFDGGTMKLVLGAWGTRSCPSAMWDPEGFRSYYHLAKNTLGSPNAK